MAGSHRSWPLFAYVCTRCPRVRARGHAKRSALEGRSARAQLASLLQQCKFVTEKRIQTWMLERRWMVAVENSENALLVENDMRDNKQQRDSRCATWRKFLETKLYKFRFLFFSSTFIQDGGEKWFRFSRGKAGFHR